MPFTIGNKGSYGFGSTETTISEIYPETKQDVRVTITNIINATASRRNSRSSIKSIENTSSISYNNIKDVKLKTEVINSKPKWHRYIGILLTILAMMTMSLMALTAKILDDYHPFALSFWRYCGNIIPTIPIILYLHFYKKEPIFREITSFWGEKNKENRTSIVGILVRGLIGGGTTISRFAAQTYISFADTSVITQSTPAIVFIFAFLCLGEKCSIVGSLSATLAIAGLCILARPPILTGQSDFSTDTLIGIGLATTALFCSATSIILTRKLRKVNFAILIFGYGIGGILVSCSLAFGFGVFRYPTTLYEILVISALVVLTFGGQMFTILALKYEEAGTVSIISLSYVIFAVIWQIIFLHNLPDTISIVGSIIVVTGILLTSLRKWVSGMSEEDSTRQKLSCLLR